MFLYVTFRGLLVSLMGKLLYNSCPTKSKSLCLVLGFILISCSVAAPGKQHTRRHAFEKWSLHSVSSTSKQGQPWCQIHSLPTTLKALGLFLGFVRFRSCDSQEHHTQQESAAYYTSKHEVTPRHEHQSFIRGQPFVLHSDDFKHDSWAYFSDEIEAADSGLDLKRSTHDDAQAGLDHDSEAIVCNVSEFGAVGDGKFLNTKSIQASITFCARKGGGVVFFPPGKYLTGTIFLKSNITLQIDDDAIILGSSDEYDFPHDAARWYTVLAENADNVAIAGGVIDGQGLKFVASFGETKNAMISWNQTGTCDGKACRPRLIGVVNCTNVHICNIEFRNPALWCLHINMSNNVKIRNVSIFGDFNSPSTDGIDIDSSNNTVIKDCHIDTADDGIVSKTTAGALYNLTVKNCWVRSKSCAVKLGSESRFAFGNLHFEGLTVVDSHRGLGLQLRDSGSIHNVTFVNVVISTRFYDPSWWGNSEPIYVTACPRDPFTKVGSISRVHFINISAISENGIILAGSSSSQIQGLQFNIVSLKFSRSTNFPGGLHDYRPGCQGLTPHHMSGIFMEYITNASLQDVTMDWDKHVLSNDWGLPLSFTPSTITMLKLTGFRTNQST